MTRTILLLLFTVLFTHTPFAQKSVKTIHGKVIDAETGNGLDHASIRIYNTQSGTLANSGGHFKMGLWQLPTTLAITHVGYYPERIVISETSENAFVIKLTNRSYSLPEIVVTPQHPYLRQFTFNGGSDGHWSPDGKHIAFISTRSGNPEVWVKPLTGEAPVQYTNNEVWDCSPTWSPNGKHIAFVSEEGEHLNIWTLSANGDNLQKVTADSDKVHDGSISKWGRRARFSWSPNGHEIAFTRRGKDTGGLRHRWLHGVWRIPFTGGTAQQMPLTGDHHSGPLWSPDGTRLAFTNRGKSQTTSLKNDNINRRGKQLWRRKKYHYAHSWSPNSKWLAITGDTEDGTSSDMWLVRVKDQKTIRLSKTPTRSEGRPTWSPDGQHLTFTLAPSGYDLWTIPSKGGESTRLAECVESADWSPNSKEIAFVAYTDKGKDIFRMPSEGGEWLPITSGGKANGWRSGLSWSPDGNTLAIISNQDSHQELKLWTIPANGGRRNKITDYRVSYWHAKFRPRWSPNGKQIAFSANGLIAFVTLESETIRKQTMKRDTTYKNGMIRRVDRDAEAFEGESDPTWSPDGKWIAFTLTEIENSTPQHTIYIKPSAGGEPRKLVSGLSPEWSPDSKEILFIPEWSPQNPFSVLYKESANKGNSAPRSLHKIAISGGIPTPVVPPTKGLRDHRWSPDGKSILYLTAPQANLWILNLKGTKFKSHLK